MTVSDAITISRGWIDNFNSRLAPPTADAYAAMFLADSYWRDTLGLGWELKTLCGQQEIAAALREAAAKAGMTSLVIDDTASPPQTVTR
ncbi:MAG: monooxygenase, partial [Alphaproteobacteria bacterium]|nr:monooxygenase [Alphaproteobacteria bacterium]